MAVNNKKHKENSLIHHSDRGLQYCSNEYQRLLEKNEIKPSMTEKYDPYKNAIAEQINGILKQEFSVAQKIKDFNVKNKLVKNAIEIYNNIRPHLSNEMLTSIQMHAQKKIDQNNTN